MAKSRTQIQKERRRRRDAEKQEYKLFLFELVDRLPDYGITLTWACRAITTFSIGTNSHDSEEAGLLHTPTWKHGVRRGDGHSGRSCSTCNGPSWSGNCRSWGCPWLAREPGYPKKCQPGLRGRNDGNGTIPKR